MKEQYELLMYQAGLTADGCWDQMDDYDKEAIERYGRLIVQRCCDLLMERHEDSKAHHNYFHFAANTIKYDFLK